MFTDTTNHGLNAPTMGVHFTANDDQRSSREIREGVDMNDHDSTILRENARLKQELAEAKDEVRRLLRVNF